MEKKFFSVVRYNAVEIFLIFELKYFHENQFFSKMILTHESDAQEDQFDGKKRRPKISWYYPFKQEPGCGAACWHSDRGDPVGERGG